MNPDGTLKFLPIKELESLRTDAIYNDSLVVTEKETEIKAGDGVSFELKFKIDLKATDAECMELDLRCGDGKKTVCKFDFRNCQLSVDRNHSDGWSEGMSKSVMSVKGKEELDVHIFSDQSSLEIFTDDYSNNHSNNVFAGNKQNQIRLRSLGGTVTIRDIESYGIKECMK